ncbi:alginate lyase family protein [Halomonas sp. HP20-15]|uniref:alginate lyase family protein n=1 Tax=Halomonas sp. HP20-15 TaxID=3085901 RepID=UPI00298267B0|nr:alginate lyase family protein [Halomonas sp. HP20-15]MDW5378195.1 alginate lyase family protein [Halomonas sp. HP20-15]
MFSMNGIHQDVRNRRPLGLLVMVTLLLVGWAVSVQAMSIKERQQLDLSEYKVTRPNASYFDVQSRMKLLQQTENSLLLTQVQRLSTGPSCQQLLQIPPLDTKIRIPGFYPSPQAWREISGPLFKFEKAVANLAGAYVTSGDDYYAECMVRFLDKWAQHDALSKFYYDSAAPQAWFSTESMIFTAAEAYSVVRPAVDGMTEQKQRIDDWLKRLAYAHKAIPGQPNNSCCNNHFYRRALYASMVGVLTEDDELFRFGVSAIYSALNDMTDEGAFPLEMKRGRRATHYQNYALLYLIPNMQIIAQQGYDIYNLEVNGHTIHDAVNFVTDIMIDPEQLGELAPHEQYKGFLKDDQYLAWMEIYLSHFDAPRLTQFLDTMRPIANRGAGGYVTLYFMDPEAQQQEITEEQEQQARLYEDLE